MGKKFIVLDKYGHFIRKFHTYDKAVKYKTVMSRMDWHIVHSNKAVNSFYNSRKSTLKQKNAVKYVLWVFENYAPDENISFNGNIDNFYEVSDFLSLYLEDAKHLDYVMYNTLLECSDIL